MSRFLITGASGTVGSEVVRALDGQGHTVVRGQRRADPGDPTRAVVDFDTGAAPEGPFDAIFLMRPPQIADPEPFRRMLDRYDRATRIVFLSVSGAERKSYLPHAKIEKVVDEMGFTHCFIRPGYFMENLLTTLAGELAASGRIVLPAGKLGFDWVSARDVGEMAAHAMSAPKVAPALRVTTGQATGFGPALDIVNRAAGTRFRYAPKSVLGFVRYARRGGMDWPFILVMLMLHSLPRVMREPVPPGDIENALGRPPETLYDWALRNAEALRALERR